VKVAKTVARDPGEWYEERAERLEHELAGARQVYDAIAPHAAAAGALVNIAREVVRRLERQLEGARDVGD
jgi:cob(I)alamin adenosyltransferase